MRKYGIANMDPDIMLAINDALKYKYTEMI